MANAPHPALRAPYARCRGARGNGERRSYIFPSPRLRGEGAPEGRMRGLLAIRYIRLPKRRRERAAAGEEVAGVQSTGHEAVAQLAIGRHIIDRGNVAN